MLSFQYMPRIWVNWRNVVRNSMCRLNIWDELVAAMLTGRFLLLSNFARRTPYSHVINIADMDFSRLCIEFQNDGDEVILKIRI